MADHDLEMAARRLRDARKARGLSQDDVAELTGIARATLHSYESGTRGAKLSTFKKLALVYGVPAGYLAGFDTEIKNESDYLFPASSAGTYIDSTPDNELIGFHKKLLERHKINPSNCGLMQCSDNYCLTGIKSGDFAIVDHSITKPDRPALFAIQDGDYLIFRWARRETGGDSIIIYADDEKHFSPFRIGNDGKQTVKIIGKVIGVISWPGL